MYGFETIGSAVLICYDGSPVLATDPWIDGNPYFGSWAHDFEIPSEQLQAMSDCSYVWISHGHPDHLNLKSLERFTGVTLLLAEHRGRRIETGLRALGLTVRTLPSREWVTLTPRIRIMTIPNYNQDSILLVALGKTLLINMNDSIHRPDQNFIRRIAATFETVFHLQLVSWGGADMRNLYAENGEPITDSRSRGGMLGVNRQLLASSLGATHTIPFSSFHRYQRADSCWANCLVPSLEDYSQGESHNLATLLPAFVRHEIGRSGIVALEPAQRPLEIREPELFGDNWDDDLSMEDKLKLKAYFERLEHLKRHFGFVRFKVGRTEYSIDLAPSKRSGFTFSAPRASLMNAVEWEIFDDLLIANFMKVTLHGGAELYPQFTPFVAKYGDNGMARSEQELKAYFSAYGHSPAWDRLRSNFEAFSTSAVKLVIPEDSNFRELAKKTYHLLKFGGRA